MKLNELVSFAKLSKTDGKPDTGNVNPDNAPEEKEEEHIDRGTKIKIIAALVVVGFAVYVAWWVQEPGSVRAAEDMGASAAIARRVAAVGPGITSPPGLCSDGALWFSGGVTPCVGSSAV
jgi:hypothetical protein